MFDFLPSAPTAEPVSDPRLFALRLLATSGARLALAGARLGGEDGAALVHALRDMALDADVDPIHWPVDEALETLRRPAGHPDAQVDRLIADLTRLREAIASDAGRRK
jgi:hypothetical protein